MNNYYGPIHFKSVDKKGVINPIITQKLNLPNNLSLKISGIYIWGFVYSINEEGELLDVIECKSDLEFNPNSMKFIPYYVGKASKSIFSRLNKHYKIKDNDANKYFRLSKKYMKTFFTDMNFPIKYKNVKNNQQAIEYAKNKPGLIEYFNDGEFLNITYPNQNIPQRTSNGQQWPITNFNFIPDTLDDFVNANNNFWFCFMPIENNISLGEFESETFYGLKGITLSDTKKYYNIKHISKMNDLTICDIFKHKENSNEIEINNQFNGY
jgi:hypothetical protein